MRSRDPAGGHFDGFRLSHRHAPCESHRFAPDAWFWSVNGAAGVLASGIAVGCSISTSIDVTVRLGAVAYLVLAVAGVALLARAEETTERSGVSPTSYAGR